MKLNKVGLIVLILIILIGVIFAVFMNKSDEYFEVLLAVLVYHTVISS